MANYPAHGSANWDSPLKGYIDAQDANVLAEALSEMQDLVDGVSFGGLTLSAANPVVPELSNVNEWTVSDAVQVDLPAVDPGSQFTVHVKSGFHDLTWPNGTTVYGETDQDDVWVTLIRADTGWNVLVPSPAPEESAAGLDTGWVILAVGMNSGGTVEWEVNPGTALDSNWGPDPYNLGAIRARRTGNTFHLLIEGIAKLSEGTSDQTVYTLPSTIDIDLPQNMVLSDIVPTLPTGSPLTHGMARLAYEGNARRVLARAIDGSALPVGTVLGNFGSEPGGALLSFPIEATSTWGT